MDTSLNQKKVAVVGLGMSNISVIRYLIKHDLKKFTAFDTRQNPPHISDLPVGIDLHLGPLDKEVLATYDMVVIGPGISIYQEEIAYAKSCGVEIVGDIELFARVAKAPIVGITGSNGKSTVTSLVAYMANVANIKVGLGGNIGIPVFDILSDDIELYVLELSSFELETCVSLKLKAATILNVSEDHLDRYHGSIEEYAMAKQVAYHNAQNIIINRQDERTKPILKGDYKIKSFGSDYKEYGLEKTIFATYLTVDSKRILNVNELKIYGEHNYLNALACMALADSVGIDRKAQVEALRTFTGLPHRCQLVKVLNDVSYYNDSKATNVASTEAAIAGLRDLHKNGIILLAGGLGKGQDFTPLKKYLGKEISKVFCFGKDKQQILDLSSEYCINVETMQEALDRSKEIARSGQAVLLSPACASFDQFKGFEHRGQVFVELVSSLES